MCDGIKRYDIQLDKFVPATQKDWDKLEEKLRIAYELLLADAREKYVEKISKGK